MTIVRRGLVVTAIMGIIGLGLSGSVMAAGPTPAQQCEAKKNQAAGAKATCLAKGYAAVAEGRTYNFAQCETNFTNAFASAEQKAGLGVCPTEGDTAVVEAMVDTCMGNVASALAGSPPPCGPPGSQLGPLVVRDSAGRLVGRVYETTVLRFTGQSKIVGIVREIPQIGPGLFQMSVQPEGFLKSELTFLHTSVDCSGPRYLHFIDPQFEFYRSLEGGTNNGLVSFYVSPPIQPLFINSLERIPVDVDPSLPGNCEPFALGQRVVGVATPFNLSDLQLSPPFHAE